MDISGSDSFKQKLGITIRYRGRRSSAATGRSQPGRVVVADREWPRYGVEASTPDAFLGVEMEAECVSALRP